MKLSRSTRPLCFTRQRQVITYVIRLCDGGERKFDLQVNSELQVSPGMHLLQPAMRFFAVLQSREKGHVLMDALCSSLGLLDPEVHYFGLRFTDRHSVTVRLTSVHDISHVWHSSLFQRWLALNKSLRCQVGGNRTPLFHGNVNCLF